MIHVKKLVDQTRYLYKGTYEVHSFLKRGSTNEENKVQQISHKLINIVVFVAIVEYAYLFLHFY